MKPTVIVRLSRQQALDPFANEGIDPEASLDALEGFVEEALGALFPRYAFEVRTRADLHQDEIVPPPFIPVPDLLAETVEHVVERVWMDGDWLRREDA